MSSRQNLRLEAALTLAEAWRTLAGAVRDGIPHRSLSLELLAGRGAARRKVLQEGDPALAAAWRGSRRAAAGGKASVVRSAAPGGGRFLAMAAACGRDVQATLVIGRTDGDPGFSQAELRWAEAFRPRFQAALRRVIGHERAALRSAQLTAILEYVPIGLLMLDWNLKPVWRNNEAANCCAVWNRGERRAFSYIPRQAFRVPPAIVRACAEMRASWQRRAASAREPNRLRHAVVSPSPALHAEISIHRARGGPFFPPMFLIHLDYRRPRGDRARRMSKEAVALLDRLSVREREVAMWLREGLRNAEIAAEMRVSPATIKVQAASIYAKLGVGGRVRTAALLNR
jgi:DNA-binding CsgD family transcriptional regulator